MISNNSNNKHDSLKLKKIIAVTLLVGAMAGITGCSNTDSKPAKEKESTVEKDKDINVYSAKSQAELYNPNNLEEYGYGSMFLVCSKQSEQELGDIGVQVDSIFPINEDISITFRPISAVYLEKEAIDSDQELYGDIRISDDLTDDSVIKFLMFIVSRNQPINAENVEKEVLNPYFKGKLKANLYLYGAGVEALPKDYVDRQLPA